ncbi:hypothetical protein BN1723_005291, partial [Verticillium longisporum]
MKTSALATLFAIAQLVSGHAAIIAATGDAGGTGMALGENVCMVRCINDANAGPFGGVVPVQLAGTANATEARRLLARATMEKARLYEKMKRDLH